MTARLAALFHGQHAFSTTVIAIFATATTLFILGRLSEPGWIDLIKWTFASFIGGGAAAAYRDAFGPKGVAR